MKVENWFNRHIKEIILTSVMIAIAVSLWAIAMTLEPCVGQEASNDHKLCGLAEKLSYAIFVSLLVRWTIVWFQDVTPVDDIYGTTNVDLIAAMSNAKQRIWILETWFTTDGDAAKIIETGANDIKIILASFKPKSQIFARIYGRKIRIGDAKSSVNRSISRFVDKGKITLVKFYSKHYPSFVYVLDEEVFWGCFPINTDAHLYDYLIQRDNISNKKGEFWKKQFERAWKESHSFDEECTYNKKLQKTAEQNLSALGNAG